MEVNDRNLSRWSHWSILTVLALGTAVACGEVTPAESPGSGGQASGGSDSGGTIGSGGAAGSGGTTTGSGGSEKSGGTQSTGGASSGGAVGSGGTSASGGASESGGSQGTGGTTASGGSRTGTGGDTSTTGPRAGRTGGERGSGGVRGTGGARPDGGGTGGASGTGGSTGDTFNPCPAGSACKIMPLGDSITEGCCSNTWGGYRIELFRQSVKDGKNITFVGNLTNGPSTVENKQFPQKHEGHGGWTISQIAGIADSTLSTNKPNIVLLKIGTNDINGTGSSGAPNGLKNLINQITKDVPSALLVVSSIIPITNDGTNSRVKTYNATIPTSVKEAADAGKHVIFVDSYEAFVADSSWKTKYMGDSLHPNTAGYVVLGQTWYAAIGDLLPAAP